MGRWPVICQHKPDIDKITHRYGVDRVGVFGSTVRGEDTMAIKKLLINVSIFWKRRDTGVNLGFVALVVRSFAPLVDHLFGTSWRILKPLQKRVVWIASRDYAVCVKFSAVD